ALLPCVGAALLIHCSPGTLVGRFLTLPPLVFVGLISYSLYLWHWPVLVFGQYFAIGQITTIEVVGLLFLSAVLATLTWRFVEQPFRSRQLIARRKPLFACAAGAIALVAASMGGLILNRGWPS